MITGLTAERRRNCRFVSKHSPIHLKGNIIPAAAPVCFKTANWAFCSIPKSCVSEHNPAVCLPLLLAHRHHIFLMFKQPHGYDAAAEVEGVAFKLTQCGSTQTTQATGLSAWAAWHNKPSSSLISNYSVRTASLNGNYEQTVRCRRNRRTAHDSLLECVLFISNVNVSNTNQPGFIYSKEIDKTGKTASQFKLNRSTFDRL